MNIYISNYLSRSISVIDYQTLTLEHEIILGPSIYPHHFCIDKEENKIYIPSMSNGTLYILDISSEKIVDSVSIGGSLSQIFLYGDELFISNEDTNSIDVLDKFTLDPITMISVDDSPHGFSYYQKLKRLYVPCINSIIGIDVEQREICKKLDIDYKAWHLEVNTEKNEIYIGTLDGKLVILNEENLEVKDVFNELLLPVQIKFNYRDKKVYISDLGYNQIKILDYNQRKYIGKIDIDGIPQGLDISYDYSKLFVSDTQNNTVKIYDTSTNKLIEEICVGKEPTTIICL